MPPLRSGTAINVPRAYETAKKSVASPSRGQLPGSLTNNNPEDDELLNQLAGDVIATDEEKQPIIPAEEKKEEAKKEEEQKKIAEPEIKLETVPAQPQQKTETLNIVGTIKKDE